jgi:ribonuclease HII
LYKEIIKTHCYLIGGVSNYIVDKINIYNANLFAMKKLLYKLERKVEIILINGLSKIF